MKKITFLAASLSLAGILSCPARLQAQDVQHKVSNPVVSIYDGCVERFMGNYYAMGTGTVGKIYRSKNLTTWSDPTLAATTDEATWLDDPKWTQAYTYKRVGAGDILYRNGVFHIYFNGIGHSYSALPLGMYKEQCIDEPFDGRGIDAQVFQDEDGEIYYVKKVNPGDPHPITGAAFGAGAKIWTFHMQSPFVRKGIPGAEQMRHQPGHPTNVDWENFEGPELFKYRDNYYMMFSPNRMSARTGMYLIGAAQSDGVMNFSNAKKYPHPILMRNMENHHFIYEQILHTAEHGPWSAKYRTADPTGNWTEADYNDAGWTTGNGGFGAQQMDIARVRSNRTLWTSPKIYIRRKFTLDHVPEKIALKYRVEANTEFYINGNKLTINQSSPAYSLIDVDPSWFTTGENIIAVKAENDCSGSDCFKFVDFGLFDTKGQEAEKIVIGQSQANFVTGPGGFERWVMYKAFFNGVSAQGIDRLHFYDKELVSESGSSLHSPGYHPVPAQPTAIHYLDYRLFYAFEFMGESKWNIANGTLMPAADVVSALLLRADPMTNYRYEVPFRIMPGKNDYMAAYAWYQDEENWMKVRISRDDKTWGYEIMENGSANTKTQALPEKFQFLEDNPLVAHYDEPWHTLTVYKNGGNFKVELDYFNLTLDGQIETHFTGEGRIGVEASSKNVSFDALQYTNGWDEWDDNIAAWETVGGNWQIGKNGLQQSATDGKALAIKGDRNYDYEFSAFMKRDHIPAGGKAGFYPLYIDENNYVEAAINYATGKLDVVENKNGSKNKQELPLQNNIYRQYTFETYPTTVYRYDFRSETKVSGVNILWFEGNYPYLNQTFDLPEQIRFSALQNGTWVPLNHKLEGALRFAYFNTFTFDEVTTEAIKIEVTPKAGKACRAFSAYFDEELAAGYYLRGRRENDRLYIYVNDSLKLALDGKWDKSNVGLFTENLDAGFNGILSYQTGKVAVKEINITAPECEVGETVQLSASVEPLNATNKHIVWESSNPTIASIDAESRLTRHTEGQITITAWSADGTPTRATVTWGEDTGLDGLSQAAISLSPNPASTRLTIRTPTAIDKVEVYSLQGVQVLEQCMETNAEELNISDLHNGTYLLFAYTKQHKISTKFIKI